MRMTDLYHVFHLIDNHESRSQSGLNSFLGIISCTRLGEDPKIGRMANSIDAILVREGGTYKAYTVTNSQVSLIDIASYFDQKKYVDTLSRISGLIHKDRSGDIILIMKDELDLAPGQKIEDLRFTTGVACKSWHGSLNRSDSYVPLLVSYPGGNRFEVDGIINAETLCKEDYSKCKGNWNLGDIVKGLILDQLK